MKQPSVAKIATKGTRERSADPGDAWTSGGVAPMADHDGHVGGGAEGPALRRLGEEAEARQAFEKVLELAPETNLANKARWWIDTLRQRSERGYVAQPSREEDPEGAGVETDREGKDGHA